MREKKKIAHFGAIFIFNSIFKGIFEWGLIPLSMVELGPLKTFIFTILFLLSFGFITIKIYDFYRFDLLESFKESQSNKTKIKERNKILDMIIKWTDKNKFLLGLFLSSQNPGLLVLYYREGYHLYNGIRNKKIILIFLRNILILALYLNTLLYLGLLVFK